MNPSKKLKSIPHLKLSGQFSSELLVNEVRPIIPDLIGYELPGKDRSQEERDEYRKNWLGRGLVDFEPDSAKGMFDARSYQGQPPPITVERTKLGEPIYYRTELADKLPTCMKIIEQLFDSPGRCRITSITAGGGLHWHSHCQFKTTNYVGHDKYDLAIIHVPIITNPKVEFGVTKFHHDEHGINPVWQHYGVGECWLLNSWHEHNVRNEGDDDRIHLMMYGSLSDPKLSFLIRDALENYDGVYIDV